MSHVLEEQWFVLHVWIRHGTHMNESCHTWRNDNETCQTYAHVMSRIWTSHVTHDGMIMSRVTHVDTSRHAYEWVKLNIGISHVSQKECVMSHIWMRHVTRIGLRRNQLKEKEKRMTGNILKSQLATVFTTERDQSADAFMYQSLW